MGEEPVPPDEVRCRRTDGKDWRCVRKCMEGRTQCEVHYLQSLHRQQKRRVPETLKLKRRWRSKKMQEKEDQQSCKAEPPLEGLTEELSKLRDGTKVPGMLSARAKDLGLRRSTTKRGGIGMNLKETLGRALSLSLKKMKLKKRDLKGELVRMVVSRELERRGRSESLVRDLPNGVMLIPGTEDSTVPDDDVFQGRVGSPTAVVERRPVRSKNAEPAIVGTFKAMPRNFPIGVDRKQCHQCRKSDGEMVIRCSNCNRTQFCRDCIARWYSAMSAEQFKNACPLCRGCCSCEECMHVKGGVKGSIKLRDKVNRIRHAHYLICSLLPILKQINQDRTTEIEIESKLQGVIPSCVPLRQIECGQNEQLYCDNCKSSIVDLHRSCSKCSYDLCLSCCQEIRNGNLPGRKGPVPAKYNRRGGAYIQICRPISAAVRHSVATKSAIIGSTLAQRWKPNGNGGIPCPPNGLGGCANHNLDLKCIFPSKWMSELEESAEETACSYDFPEVSDPSIQCPFCFSIGSKFFEMGKQLRKAADREGSDDNYLYCPTKDDIQEEDVEHFQKHWMRGQPVIVHDVLQDTTELSWDPLTMLRTICEKNGNRLRSDMKIVKATDCLDWCEIDINVHQYFGGYFEGRAYSNLWPEMLKLEWPSPDVFEECLPCHMAKILNALPFQDYTNPQSGLLNLVAKLPEGCMTNTTPRTHVAYGFADELGRGDSVDKLHFEVFDMVYILTHVNEVPLSLEQHIKIEKLKKKHRAQDVRELNKQPQMDQPMLMEVKHETSSLVHMEGLEQDSVRSGYLSNEGGYDSSLVIEDSCVSASTPRSAEELDDVMENKKFNIDHDCIKEINDISSSQSSKKSEEAELFPKDLSEEDSTDSRERLTSDSCGALWDVFRREDVPRLMDYLRKYSHKFRHTYCSPVEHVVHPIFDKSFFLDAHHISKLKEEYQIQPWSFEQHVGEAVLIPAGCPHQVRNLKSNMKVSMHFVSPESMHHCLKLADELRSLPRHHQAKDVKSDLKKMALYSISSAVEDIRELTSRSRSGTKRNRVG
ncbi:lysine-specific demethylase JMJ26-like isoform X2 [Nymphaea colorata]|uniref:lysine-specific demethylase JMJ26-like isoform X2 n=1 Tax=Nymphaea colorata TaxID=210225 RepID=UPI00129E8D99|nr:lysine-specific demethylase JMJ26-like isoform X2 [Nymphaea colorata]